MGTGRRIATWIVLVASTLVVVGVVLQVYFIAAYFSGSVDAVDLHQGFGFIAHAIEIVVFLAAIAAWWRRWGLVALALALPVVGTVQIALAPDGGGGQPWVHAFHGALALAVFVLAAVLAHRAMHALGLGRRPAAH